MYWGFVGCFLVLEKSKKRGIIDNTKKVRKIINNILKVKKKLLAHWLMDREIGCLFFDFGICCLYPDLRFVQEC